MSLSVCQVSRVVRGVLLASQRSMNRPVGMIDKMNLVARGSPSRDKRSQVRGRKQMGSMRVLKTGFPSSRKG